jgi:hypothetical protein
VSGRPTRASALSTAKEGAILGDQWNEIGVAHTTEAASAVHSTVSFFIFSSLQVSKNIILFRLVDQSSLVDWNAAKGVSAAQCPSATASPLVGCFYPSVTVSGCNTLRTTLTSPNIDPEFGAARTAFHEQRRRAEAFALESGRAFWQLTDAMRLGSADVLCIKVARSSAA